MSDDTAQNFMLVAKRFANTELFGIAPTILYELAKPSTSNEVVDAVIAQAKAGEKVTVSAARQDAR